VNVGVGDADENKGVRMRVHVPPKNQTIETQMKKNLQ
jgi:hypothetical protein